MRSAACVGRAAGGDQNAWRTPRANSLTERSDTVVRPVGTEPPMRPVKVPLALASFLKRVS